MNEKVIIEDKIELKFSDYSKDLDTSLLTEAQNLIIDSQQNDFSYFNDVQNILKNIPQIVIDVQCITY